MSSLVQPTQSIRPHSALRALAVGDCNTGGITNPPVGNTILDKFCRRLEHEGHATTSQNLGFGMGCTREGVQLMRRDAKPADVMLVNFGLVDTWITSIPQVYILYYPDSFLRKRLRKLLKFVKRRLRAPRIRRFISAGPVVPMEEYSRNIREIIAIARERNPQTAVLLWGSPPVQRDPDRNVNLERYNLALNTIAATTGGYYVDTTAVVEQLPAELAYLDDVHLNEAATQAIADQLANVYLSQQLAAAG